MGNAISPRIPAKRCRKEENEGEQTPEGMEQIRNQEVQEDEQINENESF
jgi:hypothetical protein